MKVENKKSSGYTLIELLIAVAIVGIVASSVSFAVFDMVTEKRTEHDVLGFWSELVTLRSHAMKDNLGYQVILDVNNNSFSVERMDDTGNAVVDLSGLRSQYLGLTFGRATDATDIPLQGGLASGDVDGARYDGQWATDNAITFLADEMGSITSGVLYLQNRGVPEIGYAIVKYPNLHTIKLLKWSRSKWYEM